VKNLASLSCDYSSPKTPISPVQTFISNENVIYQTCFYKQLKWNSNCDTHGTLLFPISCSQKLKMIFRKATIYLFILNEEYESGNICSFKRVQYLRNLQGGN